MDELHGAADKLLAEADHLDRMLAKIEDNPEDEDAVMLALSAAKRVRRESSILVKCLAILRDDLQPGGTR